MFVQILGALSQRTLSNLRVHELRDDAGLGLDVLATASLPGCGEEEQHAGEIDLDLADPIDPAELERDVLQEARDDGESGEGGDHMCLLPRSKSVFYAHVLEKMRMWQRPPHDACTRCESYTVNSARMTEFSNHAEIVARAGGTSAAWKELRDLEYGIADLRKHVTWLATARLYLKDEIEMKLGFNQGLWQLDFGGGQDSEGGKFNIWSATTLATGRPQENFDFFFDAVNQAGREGAKKNGKTGIYFIGQMLDPAEAPEGVLRGQSMYSARYPDVREIFLSGDTGNGYRAYEMLEELSKVFAKFGYVVKLIPLPPGHAWNRTDARIAHINVFLKWLKKKSRVRGAREIAAALRKAGDASVTKQRKVLERSWVFFRVVPPPLVANNNDLGAQLFSPALMGGHIGVHGLLYVDFSFVGADGTTIHPEGYARVREHADPSMANNPTFVYTWRKSLAKTICQPCSDRAVKRIRFPLVFSTTKYCCINSAHRPRGGRFFSRSRTAQRPSAQRNKR
jgi:hypothetical protein